MTRPKELDREHSAQKTRKVLLDAAAEAFATQGYNGANINRISNAAGFAKGTIYNHFSSKRELMRELIIEIGSEHFNYIAPHVLRESDPESRLQRFFEAGFEYVQEFYSRARVMVLTLYGSDQEFNQVMYQAYLPMFRLVREDILSPGIEAGTFRPMDLEQTANLIMTIYLGTSSTVNQSGKTWIHPKAVADFVNKALCDG